MTSYVKVNAVFNIFALTFSVINYIRITLKTNIIARRDTVNDERRYKFLAEGNWYPLCS